MNKKTIIASLNKIANALDNNKLYEDANEITNVMTKISQMQLPVAPVSRTDDQSYGYQAAVDKWINTNKIAVDEALKSPMPMQALAPLLMNIKPVELANAIRTHIGKMKQGLV